MCKSENNSKMYSRDYNPDFNDLKNKLAPDIKFVCKEKLIIQAHKEIFTCLVILV